MKHTPPQLTLEQPLPLPNPHLEGLVCIGDSVVFVTKSPPRVHHLTTKEFQILNFDVSEKAQKAKPRIF